MCVSWLQWLSCLIGKPQFLDTPSPDSVSALCALYLFYGALWGVHKRKLFVCESITQLGN